MAHRLLIIDDDEAVGKTLCGILKKAGYEPDWSRSGREALSRLRDSHATRPIRIAFIDIRLPDLNGLEVLREGRLLDHDLDAVMMTGYADTDTAVRAVNEGAFAYLLKPHNIEEVKAVLSRLVERQELKSRNHELVEELREANAALEGKVADRTRELAAMIEKLKAADELKSSFVSMVAHELRTPLTVICGYAESLMLGINSTKPEDQLRGLQIINRDAHRLARLIQNILDLSRIEKGIKVNLAPLDLRQLADAVVQGLQVTRPDVAFELDFDAGLGVFVSDRDVIEQLLINLVGNALKYAPDGAAVKIRAVDLAGAVEVAVIDSGPGIPENLRAKIFEAFFRMPDAVNRKTPGTGLGLTIVKSLLQAIGGTIRVEDAPSGRGAAFVFTLPKIPQASR